MAEPREVRFRDDRLVIGVSGCHSGPNPSPGFGVARSLRLAYPNAVFVAKDHSVQCSGLHHEVFNEVWVSRPWDELDLHQHREEFTERFRSAWFISGLDLEVRWLADWQCERALVPSLQSLNRAAKPRFEAAQALPVRVPSWVTLSAGESEVYRFCCRHDWRVWVKGSTYEAVIARDWAQLMAAASRLRDTWGSDELFVQAGVEGWEVSVAFVAFRGELLEAVFMEKRLVTDLGKTWAGEVSDVPQPLLGALRELIEDMAWTGGGELEFVRDARGDLWLIDWNPRFPAWVHGVTLAGRNLPGLLISTASGIPMNRPRILSSQFTRVVAEIPVRLDFPLPPAPPLMPEQARGGKHPSGMPLLMRRISKGRRTIDGPQTEPLRLDVEITHDLLDACARGAATPYRAVLDRTARKRFTDFALRVKELGASSPVRITPAYSVKTNPDKRFLLLARSHQLLAEVISGDELEWVLQAGFSKSDVVYNGPLPLRCKGDQVRALFADSVLGLRESMRQSVASLVGVRLRPPFVRSRFGVCMDDIRDFRELIQAVRSFPKSASFGISFHVPASVVGREKWRSLASSVLTFSKAIQNLTQVPVTTLDLGGGWAPGDLEEVLSTEFPSLVSEAHDDLPELAEVIVEPGKALVNHCVAIVCSLVELRRGTKGTREAVLDASIAEAPCLMDFPHRIVAVNKDRCELLGRGSDRLVGRLCMEHDVLATEVALPSWLKQGDKLAICDVGAYDTSMSYSFGKGVSDGRRRASLQSDA